MIDFTRNRQVIQVYSSLVRFSDLKIANQDNNLLTTMIINDLTTNYCRSVDNICKPMITRFDRFLILFRDMEGDIMRLNGEFELQLMIEDVYYQVPSSILPMNRFSMIEVFGNTRKRMCSWIILSHSINVLSRLCHSIPISCCTMCLPIKL